VGVTFGRHPSSVSSKSNVPYQKHVKSLGTVHAVGPTFLLAARAKESGSFSISSTTRCPGEQVIECAGVCWAGMCKGNSLTVGWMPSITHTRSTLCIHPPERTIHWMPIIYSVVDELQLS